LLLLVVLWKAFVCYVPPGHMLVVIAKTGEDLPAGQVLAEEGQKGIRREVLGEGYHFVWPVLYTTERKPNRVIPPGKVGVVTALGGVPPREGRVLAERDDEQGIRRQVLPPGAYRLNPYGYTVEEVPAVRIKPGFVGVKRRLLGKGGATQFATRPGEKGILKDEVLEPGLYYVNAKEYEVIPCEVGIYQKTYHYDPDKGKNTAITFPARDGNTISLDCTVEWEVLPKNWPALLARYGSLKTIESIVVDQHARRISRDRGLNYGAQDFLEGDKREKFQGDFRAELDRVCRESDVEVRSAFIRNIVLPESFLEQKRLRQLAVETRLTSEARTVTALSDAGVEREKRAIDVAEAKVKAETDLKVAVVARERENIRVLTEAEVERLRAEVGAKVAGLDAERRQALGEAEAQATKWRESAKSELFKMQLDVFGRDGDAYLRYAMAEQLNPRLTLRLFQSGPGTLWTNLGDRNMNLFLPVPGAGSPARPAGP
jgi:hypothetical protein